MANEMLISTTSTLQDRTILAYLGVVSGEVILGANILRDLFAQITDVIGGQSGEYQEVLVRGRKEATRKMIGEAQMEGANGVIGVSYDYEILGDHMMLVSVNGTAIRIK
jgi:uncharacterized protein YbjQ (UPF0145 family)